MERETSVIFADLEHAANQVLAEKAPVAARRSFSLFVNLSQKLTDVMRKEFKSLTGAKWSASAFDGWNPTTSLLKTLRNIDEHEHLIGL